MFTAIDAVHSEQFGNPTEIAREEAKMVKSTREIAFLNADDAYAQEVMGAWRLMVLVIRLWAMKAVLICISLMKK